MLEEEDLVTEPKLEALLSCLVSPAVDENPAAARLARAVLRRCERQVQPVLQRLLARLLTSPLTANSALCEQSYALVAQVRACARASRSCSGAGACPVAQLHAQARVPIAC